MLRRNDSIRERGAEVHGNVACGAILKSKDIRAKDRSQHCRVRACDWEGNIQFDPVAEDRNVIRGTDIGTSITLCLMEHVRRIRRSRSCILLNLMHYMYTKVRGLREEGLRERARQPFISFRQREPA
jgi:hypothetical protein